MISFDFMVLVHTCAREINTANYNISSIFSMSRVTNLIAWFARRNKLQRFHFMCVDLYARLRIDWQSLNPS